MRFGYADPPYLGCCKLYKHNHPDGQRPFDARCWDDAETHRLLIDWLCSDFDGWALSLTMKSLPTILAMCPPDVLTLAWFKPIAPPLGDHRRYNWEPVLVRPLRFYGDGYVPTAVVASPPGYTFRETPDTHVIGEKPAAFAQWVFASAGLTRDDEMVDVFTGSGAVAAAWETYAPGPTVADGYAASKRPPDLFSA